MQLKDRRASLMSELKGLLPKVEAGDAEAVKRTQEIQEKDMPELEKDEKAAASLREMFASHAEGEAPADDNPFSAQSGVKSFGEFVAKSVKGQGGVSRYHSITTPEYKAANSTQTNPSGLLPALTTVDTNLVQARREAPVVADLFGSETISGTSLTYFVEGAVEGAFTTVAEGAQKPQIHFGDPTPVTESLTKIAAFYKESDEIVEDLAWLTSSYNNRALYLLGKFEEAQLLNGDGATTNLTGLLNRDGVQTEQVAATGDSASEALFRAITKTQLVSGLNADAIVINPTDYQNIRLLKDANGQYIGGGVFQGQYGNGGILSNPPIWGLRTVVTSAVPAGTAVVGAFNQGGSVIRKGGVSAELGYDGDDFTNNRVTLRVEERLALAVRYPSAFVKVTLTPAA